MTISRANRMKTKNDEIYQISYFPPYFSKVGLVNTLLGNIVITKNELQCTQFTAKKYYGTKLQQPFTRMAINVQ